MEFLYWSIILLAKVPLVLLVPNRVISFAKDLKFFDRFFLFSNVFLEIIFSIFGFVIILGLLIFVISQFKKNESKIINKLIILEQRF